MTKRLLVLPVAACALGVAVLPAGAASTTSVQLKDDFFSPKAKSVKKGTTVTFKFAGKAPHNVTVVRGPVKFASSTKSSGSFKKKFSRAGTYKLTCTIHPGMDMTLTVKK